MFAIRCHGIRQQELSRGDSSTVLRVATRMYRARECTNTIE